MAYEANYYKQQGSSDTGEPGTPVEIDTTTITSRDFTLMTGRDSGDVVGSGNLTAFVNGFETVYKLSATLPVSDPRTGTSYDENRYYANIGNLFSFGTYVNRGTDDGLALFEISMINSTPDDFLQIYCYGGAGTGVMHTMFMV